MGGVEKLGVGMEQKVVQLQRRIHQQDRSHKALHDEIAGLQRELRDREWDEGRRLKILQEEIGRLRKHMEELEEENENLKRELGTGAGCWKCSSRSRDWSTKPNWRP
ncbi:unconventional myosin-Va-like [Meleagris gallopavo]|uniref:unconventional myosin-Va-like n=1 Tax=Meleagris gallopavo TaxID=9103 RepID=UPI000549A653|nr:unconventional myosin-Va-like [Meleagris gallopavo]